MLQIASWCMGKVLVFAKAICTPIAIKCRKPIHIIQLFIQNKMFVSCSPYVLINKVQLCFKILNNHEQKKKQNFTFYVSDTHFN